MSNSSSPYPGSSPDPHQPQSPDTPTPLDPNFQHSTWTPPASSQSPQQPQAAPPPGAYPQSAPPQGAYPQGAPPQGTPPQQPYAQQPYPPGAPGGYTPPAPQKSGSKLWLIGLGGCLMLFMLLVVAVVGLYYLGKNATRVSNRVIVTTQPNSTAGNTSSGSSGTLGSSVDMQTFTNSRTGLNAKLKANYADFSFDYPMSWDLERQGTGADAVNFVKVKHDEGTYTHENFAVGYFSGTLAQAPALMKQLESSFAEGFPGFTKVSEGGATFNERYNGYELAFTARMGGRTSKIASPFHLVQDSDDSSSASNSPATTTEIYGKVFLIPNPETGKNGVSIVMLGTSKSPDLRSLDDLGVKGDLPTIIDSFLLG